MASVDLKAVVDDLVAALMALPAQDNFRPKLSMLNQDSLNDEPVKVVVEMYSLLLGCRYKDFWQYATKHASSITANYPGFDLAIKKFIAFTVQLTFQSIPVVEFAGWLNLKLDQLVSFLQKEMQWQDCVVNDGLLRIPSSLADSNRMVKSNVIMESLKFEQFSKIIALADQQLEQ